MRELVVAANGEPVLPSLGLNVDATAVQFDNAVHRQAQTNAARLFLGRKKRLKDLKKHVAGSADSLSTTVRSSVRCS